MRSVDVQPRPSASAKRLRSRRTPESPSAPRQDAEKATTPVASQALPASVASTTSPVHVVPASRSRLAGRVVGCQVASR